MATLPDAVYGWKERLGPHHFFSILTARLWLKLRLSLGFLGSLTGKVTKSKQNIYIILDELNRNVTLTNPNPTKQSGRKNI